VSDVATLCRAFAAAEVRFLIVGGLAVIAHGYFRGTSDIDIVLDTEEQNLRRAMTVLTSLGYQPRAPVPMLDFASAENRRRWREEKDMLVFTVHRGGSSGHSEIDLFLESPFEFAPAASAALRQELPGGGHVPFVDLARLRQMKRAAGRTQDLLDLEKLAKLHGDG
jgi:hypothetical protein